MNRVVIGAFVAIAAAVAAIAAAFDGEGATGASSCPRPAKLPATFAGRIDNPYLPLTPGTTLTYRGKLDAKPATDLFAVTTRTKEILGVATTVVHDRVFSKAS